MSSGQRPLHRDIELGVIDDALSVIGHGGPSVIVISAGRGVGKTTLLHSALTARPGAGVVLTARCHPVERDHPFGVVRQLFDPPIDAGNVTPDLLHSLYETTRTLSGTRPLIIAIDDVNHADPQSMQWCSYIARRLDGLPIALILTTDPQDRRGAAMIDDVAALPYTRVLHPAPLCHTCAARLLSEATGTPADADTARVCHELTQGNPLLLQQIAGRLAAAGIDAGRAELPKVLDVAAAAVTETTIGWLEARAPASVTLLRGLAVVAPDDGLEIAAMLSGQGRHAAEEAARTLRQAGLLSAGSPPVFAHERVRQTILDGMDPGVRDDLHRRAATLLYRLGAPVGRAARHLMLAGPTGDPSTVTMLREAAREAAAERDWEAATGFLHRALAEAADSATVLDVTAELGAIEMHRDLPACLRHLRGVFARVRASPGNLPALAPFADLAVTINSGEAARIFTEATAMAATAAAEPLAGADLLFRLAAQALLWGATGVAAALRRLGPFQHAVVTPATGELLSALAFTTGARGRNLPRTLALTRRCFDGKGNVPLGSVLPLIWGGRIDEASYWAERGVAEAHATGSDTRLFMSLVIRAEVRYELGSLHASLADAREAIGYAEAARADGFHAAAVASAARALIELGEPQEAESLLACVDPYSDRHPLISGHVLNALGRVHLALGRPGQGLRTLLESGRRLAAAGIVNPACVPWRSNTVLAYLLMGERSAARANAERDLEHARAWGSPTAIGRALSAGSAAYDGPAKLDMLQEAVALLHRSGARLEEVRALVRLGIAQAEAGDDRAARESLIPALRLAGDCGAARLAALAERRAGAVGRTTSRPDTGAVTLTAGERRVTDLVLLGKSNLEVATALSISKRTVDTHLARIYRKLGIHTRAELAALLAGTPAESDPADESDLQAVL